MTAIAVNKLVPARQKTTPQRGPSKADGRAPKTDQAAIAVIAPEPEILIPSPLRTFSILEATPKTRH